MEGSLGAARALPKELPFQKNARFVRSNTPWKPQDICEAGDHYRGFQSPSWIGRRVFNLQDLTGAYNKETAQSRKMQEFCKSHKVSTE
jgi:hypothetical protein